MKHQEGYLKEVRDYNIFYQHWLPEGKVKAILLVVHGLADSIQDFQIKNEFGTYSDFWFTEIKVYF
jgi:alpha-beta hydrolase superfamily lysophospholipase